MLYRSPISGAYEMIPVVHTDATLDVRGLVAAAIVTQYENSSSTPVEAVYAFPLPPDAAVYDMESALAAGPFGARFANGKKPSTRTRPQNPLASALRYLEEDRPNVFTTSLAYIMPGDHINVRLRYVQPGRGTGWKISWTAGGSRMAAIEARCKRL